MHSSPRNGLNVELDRSRLRARLRAHLASSTLLLLTALVTLAGGVGCSKLQWNTHVGASARAADKQVTDIPDAPVSGNIHGSPFKVVDARVRIETMLGRERVDVFLSEHEIERCGLPRPSEDRRVWLRWTGKHALDGTPVRVEVTNAGDKAEPGPFSAHYEFQDDHKWVGHGGAAALLSLRDDGFGAYKGAVWVCFDDAEHSCVTGRFDAKACRSELDVDDSVWGSARLDAKYPAINSSKAP